MTKNPPRFPPSLNKARGKSDSELENERVLQLLKDAIRDLPLKNGIDGEKVAGAARALFDASLSAKVELSQRRKSGTGGVKKEARELEEIARRSAALLGRLKAVDGNTFNAWAEVACKEDWVGRTEATQEWLHLKRLLETTAGRAKRAAQAAVKNLPAAGKSEAGRPLHEVAHSVTTTAAVIYERLTGDCADREIDRNTHKPCGGFHDFLTKVFLILGIKSSPDRANRRLQTQLGKSAKK